MPVGLILAGLGARARSISARNVDQVTGDPPNLERRRIEVDEGRFNPVGAPEPRLRWFERSGIRRQIDSELHRQGEGTDALYTLNRFGGAEVYPTTFIALWVVVGAHDTTAARCLSKEGVLVTEVGPTRWVTLNRGWGI